MAYASAGVVGQAELNSGMSSALGGDDGSAMSAASWSFVWFGVAVGFILFLYFGFGGLRGQVAS